MANPPTSCLIPASTASRGGRSSPNSLPSKSGTTPKGTTRTTCSITLAGTSVLPTGCTGKRKRTAPSRRVFTGVGLLDYECIVQNAIVNTSGKKTSEIKTELCHFAMICRGMRHDDLPGVSKENPGPSPRLHECMCEREERHGIHIRHVPVFFVRIRTTAILALKIRNTWTILTGLAATEAFCGLDRGYGHVGSRPFRTTCVRTVSDKRRLIQKLSRMIPRR